MMPETIPLPPPKTSVRGGETGYMGLSQERNPMNCSKIEFFTVSLVNITLYTTSQLCMTGLASVFHVAEESLFKYQHSTPQ